jgi:CRISPR-associated protein Cmr4
MFKATRMLFIYVETPLHAGSGRGLGAVDLPIQRERTTNYPIVQASSLKGRMRAAADPTNNPESKLTTDEFRALFGDTDAAGAISFGDARVLLFPVRSLAGVFAWTTSVDAIARFRRAAQLAQTELAWDLPEPPEDKAWVNNASGLVAGESVVLEEFSFTPDTTHAATIQAIGNWLAQHALPQETAEYKYWREQLPKKLCILPENAFRDFVQYGTEVQTHIKLDPETKTAAGKALWTSESLPTDTLLYAPVMATDARTKVNGNGMKADEVLKRVVDLNLDRTQLGGDETTGQGFVALRFGNGGAK